MHFREKSLFLKSLSIDFPVIVLPSPAERIARITDGDDLQTVMFKIHFKHHNRILVLEGKPTIDVDAFLTFLEGELPPVI